MILAHFAGCAEQASLNSAASKKWEIRENGFGRLSGCEIGNHMFDRDPFAADDRFSAENLRVGCGAREERGDAVVGHALDRQSVALVREG